MMSIDVLSTEESIVSNLMRNPELRFCCKVKNHVIFILKNEK